MLWPGLCTSCACSSSTGFIHSHAYPCSFSSGLLQHILNGAAVEEHSEASCGTESNCMVNKGYQIFNTCYLSCIGCQCASRCNLRCCLSSSWLGDRLPKKPSSPSRFYLSNLVWQVGHVTALSAKESCLEETRKHAFSVVLSSGTFFPQRSQ